MADKYNYSLIKKNINLAEFFFECSKRWYIIVTVTFLCFIITFLYSSFFATPMYDSTAKLYIINKQSENINSSDFSISTYLTSDFADIIVDNVVLDEVADELDNKYSTSQIRSFLSIDTPDNTRIIEILVRSPNAEDSKQIADSICNISESTLVEIMGLDRVQIIRKGTLARKPSVPNTGNNVFLGIMMGFVISLFIVLFVYITDNKISSAKDVEKYLELNVLATIPYNQNKQKSRL